MKNIVGYETNQFYFQLEPHDIIIPYTLSQKSSLSLSLKYEVDGLASRLGMYQLLYLILFPTLTPYYNERYNRDCPAC